MNRRNKIIIIITVAVVVLLIVIGLFWWLSNRQEPGEEELSVNQGLEIPDGLPAVPGGLTNAAESPVKEPDLEAGLKAIASTFTERFGSYSNQGNFSNLDALRDLMTIRMRAWTDNYKASQRASMADQLIVYYGVTTKALSVQITTFDESLGQAEIIVATQRQEAKGSTINPRVFYQDLKLQLVKTGEGWKVDSAEWQ